MRLHHLCSALLLLSLFRGVGRAEPTVLRLASIVPEGTAWARELKAFSRDLEMLTRGDARIKWYLGGIAGDESTVPERIRKGQLDGEAAAVSCDRLAPSLRVMRVAGLFRRRDEVLEVLGRLRPTLNREFHASGFTVVALIWFGSDIVFSREPVRSFADLQRLRFWIWDLDEVWKVELKTLGIHAVPLPVEEAGRAYDEGRIDGFFALPTAALAYQWSVRSKYFTNLPLASMAACTIISNRSFEALSLESQAALREVAAKYNFRFIDLTASQEDQLTAGLFQKQGTQAVPPSRELSTQFLETAKQARAALPDTTVPRQLIAQVQAWLSDFRALQP